MIYINDFLNVRFYKYLYYLKWKDEEFMIILFYWLLSKFIGVVLMK